MTPSKRQLFIRYWKSASGYWKGRSAWRSWSVMSLLIGTVLAQLFVQYMINFWNRDFFNALDKRDVSALWFEAKLFIPLALASITVAILSVWARMTVQRGWREWLSKHMVAYWLKDHHYRRLKMIRGDRINAEYRIAEDGRVATDLPIDLAVGLFTSVLTAIAFIQILWQVGGALHMTVFGFGLVIPGYLVLAAFLYSGLLTGSMIIVGRHLPETVEGKNQIEAEFRSVSSRLREHGEGKTHTKREAEEALAVETTLDQLIVWWKKLCWQLMRTTVVAHGNGLIAPIVGLLLCTPQFLDGGMSLGQVVQAAAAFVTVQSCFNWLMDNYPRIADWLSSANRVAVLLLALDEIDEDN